MSTYERWFVSPNWMCFAFCSNTDPCPKGTSLCVMSFLVHISSNAAAFECLLSRRMQTRLKSRWLENILPPAILPAGVFCPSSKGVLSRGLSDPPSILLLARFTPTWRTSAPASEFRLTVEARKLWIALFGMRGRYCGGKGSRHRPWRHRRQHELTSLFHLPHQADCAAQWSCGQFSHGWASGCPSRPPIQGWRHLHRYL